MILFITLTKNLTTLLVLIISNNSSDERICKEAAIYYVDALNKAGYINKLVYHTPSTSNQENKKKSPTERYMV